MNIYKGKTSSLDQSVRIKDQKDSYKRERRTRGEKMFSRYLLSLCLFHFSTGNGYYGQREDPKQTVGQSPTPLSNNWWMNQGAFQKPSNHPGVQRTAPAQPKTPSKQKYPQEIDRNLPSLECMLRLKSDCHGGSGQSTQESQPPLPYNYESDGYPVYTAFVIPAGIQGQPQQMDEEPNPPLYNRNKEIVIPYSSNPTPTEYSNNQWGNNGQQRAPLSRNPPQPKEPSYNYRPPVVPYSAPPNNLQDGDRSGGEMAPPAEEQAPYPGCPAAMICVPESFCDAKGMSGGKDLGLSRAEKSFRVALSECSMPMSEGVGVCCRDPDYQDPWPMNGQDGPTRDGKGIKFDDGQYNPSRHGGHRGETPSPYSKFQGGGGCRSY